MMYTNIKYVWDLFYVNPEEIADAENAQEVINQYSSGQKIPIRILVIGDREQGCIVLAGEGALYPWKVGQKVEISMIQGILWHNEYLCELRIKGIDNLSYQEFTLYDSIKPIEYGKSYPDNDAVAYKGISSFKIYMGLAKHIVFKDDEYYNQRIRKSNMKHLTRSIELPQDKQWGENWEWETSYQCYELDTEFKEKEYFDQMDNEEKIHLSRKMENFLEERGISVYFARNFALLDQVFREIDKPKNNNDGVDFSDEW